MEPALTIIIAIFGSNGFWALMVDCGAYQGNPYCRTDSNRDDLNSCVDLRGQLDSGAFCIRTCRCHIHPDVDRRVAGGEEPSGTGEHWHGTGGEVIWLLL